MIATNEIYGPVQQGEGRSLGLNVMFLRTSGCDLACNFCDTAYTWNWLGTKFVHPDKYDPKLEVHKKTTKQVKDELYAKSNGVRALVISGGEPMLQQSKLIELLVELKKDNWWVEVETNGTHAPTDEFLYYINQFNCSPKTSNSGPDNPLEKRIVLPALKKLASFSISTFKFVIVNDQDLIETQEIIRCANIKAGSVWLMPEGRTRSEQEQRQEQVKELAKKYGYNFSPRLHILEFDNKRGV